MAHFYSNTRILLLLLTQFFTIGAFACKKNSSAIFTNHEYGSGPITELWVKKKLRKKGPKIILTNEQLLEIKSAVNHDEAVKAYYKYLYNNAVSIIDLPVLERRLESRRLLTVSREAVKRIGTLSIVYAISGENRFLNRANAEIKAVSSFSDWNPSHFLDVGEMSYAVSIGLDWTLGNLPQTTQKLARQALIDKALKPGLNANESSWVSGTNNWNQVCHGGLSTAAIAIADENPALAAQVLSRAVANIPKALQSYAPDGAYPEGASYWMYGTSYSLITISAFESAFGTDFGIAASPGFIQSALFVKMLASPSGMYFNYFDSGSGSTTSLESQELLSWFAKRAENGAYYDKKLLLATLSTAPTTGNNLSKLNGAALTWMVKAKQFAIKPFPVNWKGEGKNPIVIFKAKNNANGFFLGAKGGAANLSHGDMDAGSFVFDLHGIRWSVDLGMPGYTELEAVIGVKGLWDFSQGSKRWTLMGKSNFGHSTITVNDQLHQASGSASLTYFNGSESKPEAEFNLTEIFKDYLKSAKRKFTKLSDLKLQIEDTFELTDQTQSVTWAMMTQADATVINGGVMLTQNGKTLKVFMKQPMGAEIKIISKNPPPLSYDMNVPNLKRIEFKVLAKDLQNSGSKIITELSGE